MGGKSAPPPPPVPDYQGIAGQQAAAQTDLTNQQTWANRPNVQTPWGAQTWEASAGTDPSTGRPITQWTQNVSLDPQQQRALDSQMAVQTGLSDQAQSFLGRVNDSFSQPYQWNNLPAQAGPAQGGPLTTSIAPSSNIQTSFGGPEVGGASAYTGKAGDALYAQSTKRLDPQFAQAQEAQEAQLLNRGISRGSEAWNRAQQTQANQKQDAYSAARDQATAADSAEAARLQGMDANAQQAAMQRAGFGNTAQGQQFSQQAQAGQFGNAAQQQAWQQAMQGATLQNQNRQQSIAEQQQMRAQPLNELNALLSGQQVAGPNFPSFSNAAPGTAPNMSGAAGQQYGAAIDQYNAGVNGANQQSQNAMQGIGSLAALYFSDARLKRGAKRIGATKRGTPLYIYTVRATGLMQIGVLAQEAPADAVHDIGGVLAVDYSKV